MELRLIRKIRTQKSTIGELFIDNTFECYILEDFDRGLHKNQPLEVIKRNKVYGKTAIPSGRYEIVVTWSNRFVRLLPLLLDVPGYEGIRIHTGNKDADTLGCLLPGMGYGKDYVFESRKAFDALFKKIRQAREKIFITIE